MKRFFSSIDSVIEDERKTKAVIRWMRERGMLDETAIAMFEIEQSNKEIIHCKHCYPNGEYASRLQKIS